jgi:hypothetical protein
LATVQPENESYPATDTASGPRSIRGIRSAGTTTVAQLAIRRPSRRISAPTILHSDPISLGGKIPWIEHLVTRLAETIPGWLETTPASTMVCRSPSFPSRTDFRMPAAATSALVGVPPGLRRASQVQNAGQTSWKRQVAQVESDGLAMSETCFADDSARFQTARSATAASSSASQSDGARPNSTVSPDAPAMIPFFGQKPRLSAMIAA